MKIINLLSNYSPLSGLDPKILLYLASKFHKRYYLKNQVLIRKGEIIDGLGIVSCGQLNLFLENRKKSIKLIKADFYNDIALVSQANSTMTIVSNKNSHCYVLPTPDFYSISAKYPIINNFFSDLVKEKIVDILQTHNPSIYHLPNNSEIKSDKSAYNPYILKAVDYIDKNYTQAISLDKLSQVCGVSKFYLSRLFKEYTGYTFIGYLNKRRIIEAKRIMIDLGANVTESCYEVGFNDLSHFSRLFKKMEKISPSEFLNKIGKK